MTPVVPASRRCTTPWRSVAAGRGGSPVAHRGQPLHERLGPGPARGRVHRVRRSACRSRPRRRRHRAPSRPSTGIGSVAGSSGAGMLTSSSDPPWTLALRGAAAWPSTLTCPVSMSSAAAVRREAENWRDRARRDAARPARPARAAAGSQSRMRSDPSSGTPNRLSPAATIAPQTIAESARLKIGQCLASGPNRLIRAISRRGIRRHRAGSDR